MRPEAISLRRERTGSLKLRRLVRIHSQEEGQIIELPFFEGDAVSQGQLLAAMDDRLLRAELAKAEATLGQARLDLGRLETLVRQKVASEETLARAQTNLDVANAEVRLLETRLANTRISAPFAGIISERLIEPGDIAPKHHHLLTLFDPDSLQVEVPVSELLLPLLAVGDPVTIRIDALGEQEYAGRILRIHPNLDPLTRQAPVEVVFAQAPAQAQGGQLARVGFTTPPRERLLLPITALQRDREGEFLYRLVDGKAVKTQVRSGVRIDEQVAINQGLQAGDRVIVRGFLGLGDGKAVRALEPGDGAGP